MRNPNSFWADKRKHSGKGSHCKFCVREYQRVAMQEKAAERRRMWEAYLQELGLLECSKCGYDKCSAAIDFHHVRGKKKDKGIGHLKGTLVCNEKNKERMNKELSKCIPLCATCHRETHYYTGE
jgi:hypothetical protein